MTGGRGGLNWAVVEKPDDLTLVLVNDPDVYLDLNRRLHDRGVKVVNVATGTVALEMIRSLKPALVILGYDLQDLPAGEVCRRIKKNPQTRNVPVIILYDPQPNRSDEVQGVPCDEALSRPVDGDVLMQKISARLNIPFRRHSRITIDMGVDYAHDGGRLTGFARNISEGGVFIETNDALSIGARLTLSFTLPGQAAPLSVPGEVVRRIELGRELRFGLGIEFKGMPAASREQILDFLVHKSLQVTA